MVAEYYIEIIIFIIFISLLSIFLLINKNKKSIKSIQTIEIEEEYRDEEKNKESTSTDTTETDTIEIEIETEEVKEIETLTQEPKTIQTAQELETPLPTNKKEEKSLRSATIPKREVPSHGKITKENFKEFNGTRILVAEDNTINQKVIKALLDDSGVEIIIANDGQEALNILEKDSNFTLILMDAHMPIVDGFEATRAIRSNQDYSHIVVVALSGDTAADDIKKMSEAGMQEHLEKPLRMDALYDILYAYTGKKQDNNYIVIPITVELNIDKGLAICNGDEDFYREILNEFLDTYSNSHEQIEELLNKNQKNKADQILLDIIGVSANIGAKNLQETALQLKNHILKNNNSDYLPLLSKYTKNLQLLIRDIKKYI